MRNSHADWCQTWVATFCEWNEDEYLPVKNMHHIRIGPEWDSIYKLAFRSERLYLAMHFCFGPVKRNVECLADALFYGCFGFGGCFLFVCFLMKSPYFTSKIHSAINSNPSIHFLIWESRGKTIFQLYSESVCKNESKGSLLWFCSISINMTEFCLRI